MFLLISKRYSYRFASYQGFVGPLRQSLATYGHTIIKLLWDKIFRNYFCSILRQLYSTWGFIFSQKISNFSPLVLYLNFLKKL